MSIIDEVLSREEFGARPPVLLDIGASKLLHPRWRKLSRYSEAIAFDADDRELGAIEEQAKRFRKFHLFRSIVTAGVDGPARFHLTRLPFCSSLLAPDQETLGRYLYANSFDVLRVVDMDACSLPRVLHELQISAIDWFKTDSQGTDLRLFQSLGTNIERTILYECEPGLIAFYQGEDTFPAIHEFVTERKFELLECVVKGSQRLPAACFSRYFHEKEKRLLTLSHKTVPGWVEAMYFNRRLLTADTPNRDRLLAWTFATVEAQHGLALEIATVSQDATSDRLWHRLCRHSQRSCRWGYLRMPLFIANKLLRRSFRHG
jgi:hypothetical protein